MRLQNAFLDIVAYIRNIQLNGFEAPRQIWTDLSIDPIPLVSP